MFKPVEAVTFLSRKRAIERTLLPGSPSIGWPKEAVKSVWRHTPCPDDALEAVGDWFDAIRQRSRLDWQFCNRARKEARDHLGGCKRLCRGAARGHQFAGRYCPGDGLHTGSYDGATRAW